MREKYNDRNLPFDLQSLVNLSHEELPTVSPRWLGSAHRGFPFILFVIGKYVVVKLKNTALSCQNGFVFNILNMADARHENIFATEVDFPSSPRYNNRLSIDTRVNAAVVTDKDVKLPAIVNFVALRETFLSEAPFIKRNNRGFWKRWIDSKQYCNVLALSLRLVTSCISESGAINVARLYGYLANSHMPQSFRNPLTDQLAINVAEMLTIDRDYFQPSHAHDVLFQKLPELLCYMIINALLACLPKLNRVYFSGQFRELLLDWLTEMVGGMRKTYCRADREWLFTDTNDYNIVLINAPDVNQRHYAKTQLTELRAKNNMMRSTLQSASNTQQLAPINGILKKNNSMRTINSSSTSVDNFSPNKTGKSLAWQESSNSLNKATSRPTSKENGGAQSTTDNSENNQVPLSKLSKARSSMVLTNSPLITTYMNMGRDVFENPYTCARPLKINISHLPNRPVITMQAEAMLKPGAYRERKIDRDFLHDTLKESQKNRKIILKEIEDRNRSMKKDVMKMKEAYQIQLALLEKKPVTQKQLLAAAAVLEHAKTNHLTEGQSD